MSKDFVFEYYHEHQRNINFNENWSFSLKDQSEYKNPGVEIDSFSKISLPHDWSIEFDFNKSSMAQNEAGLLDGGTGWYRKQFILGEYLFDSSIILRFGAIYMNSKIYVNGLFVGSIPNGYIPFSFDISKYVYRDGRINTIAVKVVNEQPSSRWYSGSGIYRDVHLNILNSLHFIHDSIVVNYERNNLDIHTHVSYKLSHAASEYYINVKVQEKGKSVVYEQKFNSGDLIDFKLDNVKLWSCDEPNLYILSLELYKDKTLIDTTSIQYGYRFIDWDSEDGFFLNDKSIKLKGVCLHHDNGSLGAVATYDAIYRKLSIMKEMGANAIRSSHNPCDDKTIKIAEEIGLMVIDEAFDTWFKGKKKYDYGRYFNKPSTHPLAKHGESWAEFDIKAMVRRGINSPAIIMWSLGNEINESNDASPQALKTVKKLNRWVKEIDKTRYTTMGQDVYRWAASGVHEQISEVVDAIGLNYAESSFSTIRENNPDWLIYGSETSSGTRSRGVYAFPDETRIHDNALNRRFQQSDYGNDHVAWGNSVEYCIKFDNKNRSYAGQFYWTGFDYIGEPTPWHNQNDTLAKSSYFGLVDTCGFPKNDYFLLQSQWTKQPVIHIYPHWNWSTLPESMVTFDNKIPVRVASNQHFVEVFLNGKSLGIKEKTHEVYREWRIPFKKGTIIAVGYDSQMKQTCLSKKSTAEDPRKIIIEKDKYSGDKLDYLIITTEDQNNEFNPLSQHELYFQIEGQAHIVGVDNGSPATFERYKAYPNNVWKRTLFNGMALVIVQKNHPNAQYRLSATNPVLEEGIYVNKEVDSPVSFVGSKLESHFSQSSNLRIKTVNDIKKIHTYSLFIKRGELAKESYDILVEFKDNSMGLYSFTLISKIDTSHVHVASAKAYLEPFDLMLDVPYHIEAIIGVESFCYGILNDSQIELPEQVQAYHSNSSATMNSVRWKKDTSSNFIGIVEQTDVYSYIKVRKTTERTDGVNFSQIWTGSELPLAFSLQDSNRSISRINNGDFTITDPYHLNHDIGIIFGDAGDFVSQYVDNIVIQTDNSYHNQEILIYYGETKISTLPHDKNNADTFDNYEWKPFENVTKIYDKENYKLRFNVTGQKAYAIRIQSQHINIFQVSTYEALPVTIKPKFLIKNGHEYIHSSSLSSKVFKQKGEIEVLPENNCNYMILNYPQATEVLIVAEDENDSLTITFNK